MKKFILLTFILSLFSFSLATPAHAQIQDIPEKVLKVINKINEKLILVEKKYQEFNKMKSTIKSGIMGSAAIQLFKEMQALYNTGKALADKYGSGGKVTVLGVVSDVLGSAEVINNSLSDVALIYEMKKRKLEKKGPEGAGMSSANRAELKYENDENLKNMIATLFANALYVRHQTYCLEYGSQSDDNCKSFKEPDKDISNETQNLEYIRAVLETTVKRKARVLFLESAMLEFQAAKIAADIDIDDDEEISIVGGDGLESGGAK